MTQFGIKTEHGWHLFVEFTVNPTAQSVHVNEFKQSKQFGMNEPQFVQLPAFGKNPGLHFVQKDLVVHSMHCGIKKMHVLQIKFTSNAKPMAHLTHANRLLQLSQPFIKTGQGWHKFDELGAKSLTHSVQEVETIHFTQSDITAHDGQVSGDVVVSNPYPVEQVRQIPAELQVLQLVTIWPQSRQRLSLRRFGPIQLEH